MSDSEQKETLTERFYRQKREEDHFNFVFFFVIFWLMSAAYLLSFFTKDIPNGRYLTNQVRVYDSQAKEDLFLTLVVDVEGKSYYVYEIISPNTGRAIETNYDGAAFGKNCKFTLLNDERDLNGRYTVPTSYTVTLTQKDIQISPLERIENDLLGFAIRIVLFAFFTFSLYKDYKSKKNPGN